MNQIEFTNIVVVDAQNRSTTIYAGSLDWWSMRLVEGFDLRGTSKDIAPYVDALAPTLEATKVNLVDALAKYSLASMASIFLETALHKEELDKLGVTAEQVGQYAQKVYDYAVANNLPVLQAIAQQAVSAKGIPKQTTDKATWASDNVIASYQHVDLDNDDRYASFLKSLQENCSFDDMKRLHAEASSLAMNDATDPDNDTFDWLKLLDEVKSTRVGEYRTVALMQHDALTQQQGDGGTLKEQIADHGDRVKLAAMLIASVSNGLNTIIQNIPP
jgi:hypothetical protein